MRESIEHQTVQFLSFSLGCSHCYSLYKKYKVHVVLPDYLSIGYLIIIILFHILLFSTVCLMRAAQNWITINLHICCALVNILRWQLFRILKNINSSSYCQYVLSSCYCFYNSFMSKLLFLFYSILWLQSMSQYFLCFLLFFFFSSLFIDPRNAATAST